MEAITQKLIPGIIALLCAFVFIFRRERIEEKIMNSHEKFWNQTLKFQSEIGRFGELFLKAIILFLGISFLLTGVFLIYKFI